VTEKIDFLHHASTCRRKGAALVIVLAFLVLLMGLTLAFFSRAMNDRQIATSSANLTKAELLAEGALASIVADLQNEVAAVPSDIVPAPVGSTQSGDLANLSKRSASGQRFCSGGPARAANVSSTIASINGRSISRARWNKPLLLPLQNPGSSTDSTPTSSFIAPDWILQGRDGSNPTGQTTDPAAANYVLGRYSYAIYNEGGLLDVNLAGYPINGIIPYTAANSDPQASQKGVVAFADLSQLPGITALTASKRSTFINNIVGWRNYASAQPSGALSSGYNFNTTSLTSFTAMVLSTTSPFLVVNNTALYTNQSDRMFSGRQKLINFVIRGMLAGSLNTPDIPSLRTALQYLSTFSRDTNVPTRSDSAKRLAGRFPLNRFDLFTNPTANALSIKRYFAVKYVPASQPTPEHWVYTGAESDSVQSSIHVLTGDGQDPDLSVLLRYAYDNPKTSVSDAEILSVIASLIDQRDTNDDTTWIEYANPDPSGPPLRAYGVDRNPSSEKDAPPPPAGVVVLNRAFRNTGELGYAYRNASTTLDFSTGGSVDARLLDLFTYNTAPVRAGMVDLNTSNVPVLTAILTGATTSEKPTKWADGITASQAASNIVNETTNSKAAGREDVARIVGKSGSAFGNTAEQKQTVARALAEISQTRTWNLMIDVIAQTGRYSPNAQALADFLVEGEKRYWLHIALDRFTGQVVDQQLEAVYE
jgi:hypothetical protein